MMRKTFATMAMILSLVVAANAVIAQEAKEQDDDEKQVKINRLMRTAQGDLQAEDYEAAAENFAKLLKLDPKNALAWQLHGYALHADGKLDAAIKSHMKAAEHGKGDDSRVRGIALYNLGCAYSLKGEKKKAMDYLDKAIDAGMVQLSYFETDTDLDNLRKEKRFAKIVEVVKAGGREKDGEKTTDAEESSDDKKEKFDAKSLVGKWQVTKGARGGEKIDSERLPPSIKITDKAIHIPGPDGGEGFVMAYKVNAKKSPITINIEIESGPVEDGRALGIIKLEKGALTLCYDPTGQERPEKFESTEENGCFMFVMKKMKKDDD